MKGLKKLFSFILRVLVSIILLVVLFRFKNINIHELLLDIKGAGKPVLLSAFLVFSAVYILGLLRWQMLLKAAKVELSFGRVVTSFCGGVFFSLFLPSSIGGDLARSIDLAKHTQKPKEVVATVFLDRLSGYIGLVAVVVVALLLGWRFIVKDAAIFFSIGLIVAILLAVLLVIFNKFVHSHINKLLFLPNAGKLREVLKDILYEIHYFRNHKKVIVYNLLISVAVQLVAPLVFYLTALSLGIKDVNPVYFFLFIPIIGAVTLLPISIGGFGLRESTSVIFFAKAGLAQNPAAAIALLNSFFIVIYGAIGGLIYVFTIRHRRLQHNKSPAL